MNRPRGGAAVVTIETAVEATAELVAAFARLLPQLSPLAAPLGLPELAEMIGAPGTTVLLARREDRQIAGTATLINYRIPSGRRARLESVIVDREARGRGIGRALCLAAIDHARAVGAEAVDLTSLRSRVEANAMYLRLGFELRESNVYRYHL